MDVVLVYVFIGCFAGFLAGLLGVGGGLVIVPALALIYSSQGIASPIIMHLALGTSLATIVITSLSSTYAHHRHGAVHWPIFWRLAPGIVVGGYLGAQLTAGLSSQWLQKFFAIFELAVAAQIGIGWRARAHRALPGSSASSVAGMLIGAISAVVGIGGGTMTVPFLLWCQVNIRNAVATSAAVGLPIALAGTLGFIVSGWNNAFLPSAASGFVYWPAWLGIIAASTVVAPLGARVAHRIPMVQLRKIFALFLATMGVVMWIKNL